MGNRGDSRAEGAQSVEASWSTLTFCVAAPDGALQTRRRFMQAKRAIPGDQPKITMPESTFHQDSAWQSPTCSSRRRHNLVQLQAAPDDARDPYKQAAP